MGISDRRGGHLKFIAAFYIIYSAKNLFLRPYLLFSLVNYRNTSATLLRDQVVPLFTGTNQDIGHSTRILDGFAYLATNCSSLSSHSTLERDLSRLPIVITC